MKYFYLEPEVAGGLGERSILDRSVHPPLVIKLHYEMDGWLGDVLLESFPAFIVTSQAQQELLKNGVSGVDFGEVEVTTSEEFRELYPDQELPAFVWLRPEGQAGRDDVAAAADGRLVVSERALRLLEGLGVANALVEPFEN